MLVPVEKDSEYLKWQMRDKEAIFIKIKEFQQEDFLNLKFVCPSYDSFKLYKAKADQTKKKDKSTKLEILTTSLSNHYRLNCVPPTFIY